MRFELFLVFAIVLTLNISQVQGYSNIGLVVQNLTRLPTDETCDWNNRNCKYYMELCFSLAGKPDCSLFERTSLTWVIRPGQSKILRLYDDIVQYIENPLKFPQVDKWKAQQVVLRVNVRKTDQPDFTEEILIEEKLPYPINNLAKLEENKITRCSAHFCLTVALYMWCDDIPGCVITEACVSKPCQNDGECVDDDNGGYECKCTPNWEGKNCELPKYCPAVSFSKQGCFKTPRPRPSTSELLFSRRLAIDWGNGWHEYLETIVCDCGKAARGAGYRYFCIEFYGECWGYKEFDVTQPHAGATKCWGKRPNYKTCIHDQKNPICVGTDYHGYVYEVDQTGVSFAQDFKFH